MKKFLSSKWFFVGISACLSALANAGTYSIVGGPDTTLLSATHNGNASASWSTSGYSLLLSASAGAQTTLSSSLQQSDATISGEAYWRVRWLPSYPGEPAPTSRSVTVAVTPPSGYPNIISYSVWGSSSTPGISATGMIQYSSMDDFWGSVTDFLTGTYGTTPPPKTNQLHDGTDIWSTTTFVEVSPGVWEADIEGVFNTSMIATASTTGSGITAGIGVATIGINMKYTIKTVDGQNV